VGAGGGGAGALHWDDPRLREVRMSERRITFEHDGHRFEAVERERDPARGDNAEPQLEWIVRMDGGDVLEFHGAYPYRDVDVRKRVLEWYGIQKNPGLSA
jgi:hypothetical protein